MNKRFFSEFLALVSIKVNSFLEAYNIQIFIIHWHKHCDQVNPDPYLRADPEVDIMKTDDEGPNGTAFYDEEELGEGGL